MQGTMQVLAAVGLLLATGRAVPLAKVAFSVPLAAPASSEGLPPLDQMVTGYCVEGMSGVACATDLCTQIRGNAMLQQYDLNEFLQGCETTFERAITTERAVAIAAPQPLVSLKNDLYTWFTDRQMRTNRLDQSTLRQPGKLALYSRALAPHSDAKHVCDIGFGMGTAAMLALGSLPTASVHSFDAEESKESLQVHDFLEARFPERLTLHLGDTSVLVPRFMTLNPKLRCEVLLLNGGMEDFAFRDAVADMQELANHDAAGHVFIMDVPSDKGQASNVATTLKANERKGVLSVSAVLREGSTMSVVALGKLTGAEYFAGSVVIGRFNPLPSASAEVPAAEW